MRGTSAMTLTRVRLERGSATAPGRSRRARRDRHLCTRGLRFLNVGCPYFRWRDRHLHARVRWSFDAGCPFHVWVRRVHAWGPIVGTATAEGAFDRTQWNDLDQAVVRTGSYN